MVIFLKHSGFWFCWNFFPEDGYSIVIDIIISISTSMSDIISKKKCYANNLTFALSCHNYSFYALLCMYAIFATQTAIGLIHVIMILLNFLHGWNFLAHIKSITRVVIVRLWIWKKTSQCFNKFWVADTPFEYIL